MIKVYGCKLCINGPCMCSRITWHNDILSIKTPEDFDPNYRRKYLINTHGIDPDDHTNARRYIGVLLNYLLPSDNPKRRYGGDSGYRQFINDLDATKTKPIPW